uniref:Protein kinase domain-containing protein n=1 Tax=Parascaris univalens TaxID=6257 RepID=A0A915BSY4_PARUN
MKQTQFRKASKTYVFRLQWSRSFPTHSRKRITFYIVPCPSCSLDLAFYCLRPFLDIVSWEALHKT